MKLVTGNDLLTGEVVWWAGSGWNTSIARAVDAGEQAPAILAAENAAQRVSEAWVVDADQTADGPRPAHIKDRVRALGPTVRPDLNLPAASARGTDWLL